MVSRHRQISGQLDSAPATGLVRLMEGFDESERQLLETAWCWREQLCAATDIPELAWLVSELRLDAQSLAASLLLDCRDALLAVDQPVKSRRNKAGQNEDESVQPAGTDAKQTTLPALPDGVVNLVEGVYRLRDIGQLLVGDAGQDGAVQMENLRQMLLAMVSDIRVVLIKLCERLHMLRQVTRGDDEQAGRQVAREVRDLFAPLANRLGVWQIKWEMEDLSCRLLEPADYARVARLLDEKRLDREHYIAQVVQTLQRELAVAGITASVTGRPKHIVSILNKMRRKHLDFDQLYDIRAVRILVPEVRDCYTALGLVHQLWQPVAGEFDDYISHPKSNDYRSLHTGVYGPEHKPLEVQIRTHAMHQHAELGVAAHWRYKEGGGKPDDMIDRIAWLRKILQWRDEIADNRELAELFRNELFQDRIYVLTPQGRVLDMQAGATPLDFAYQLHTDLGHRCRGAKVDGVIVPLTTPLANGQRVEILTVREGGPSRDWLNPSLGYLATARARAKVRHWFRVEHYAEHVAQGRETLQREQKRLRLPDVSLERVADRLGFPKMEDMLAALGRSDLSVHALAEAMLALQPRTPVVADVAARPVSNRQASTGEVLIEGVSGLPVTLARCCHPAPPGSIVGYATQGRGVTVHRHNCPNIARMPASRQERLLAASWKQETVPDIVEICVEAFDRQGLLRDVSAMLTREKMSVVRVNTESRGDVAEMHFHVHRTAGLDKALTRLRTMPDVVQVSLCG